MRGHAPKATEGFRRCGPGDLVLDGFADATGTDSTCGISRGIGDRSFRQRSDFGFAKVLATDGFVRFLSGNLPAINRPPACLLRLGRVFCATPSIVEAVPETRKTDIPRPVDNRPCLRMGFSRAAYFSIQVSSEESFGIGRNVMAVRMPQNSECFT